MTGGKASLFTFTDAIIDLDEFFSDMDDLTPEKRDLLEKEASEYEASFKEPEYCVTEGINDDLDDFQDNDFDSLMDSDFEELTNDDLAEDSELSELFKSGTSLGDILSGKEVLPDNKDNDEVEEIQNEEENKIELEKDEISFDDINDSIFGDLNEENEVKDIEESVSNDINFDIHDSIFGDLNEEDIINDKKEFDKESESEIKISVPIPNDSNIDEVDSESLDIINDAEHNLGDIIGGDELFTPDECELSDDDLLELEREEARLKLEAEEALKRQQEQLQAIQKRKEELKQRQLDKRREEKLKREQELKKQKELEEQEIKRKQELARKKELEEQKFLSNSCESEDLHRSELISLITKYLKKSHSNAVEIEDDDDIETLELKLDLAKLAYKKYLKNLKKQQEKDLEEVKSENKNISKSKPSKNSESIKSIIPPEISLANQTVSEKEKELEMYSSMATDDLFKIVKQYLLAKGVRNELIPLDDVINKFGKDNVKRLKDKSYIIIIRNGLTLG